MDAINEKIKQAVEELPIVDTHEHILPESERDPYAVDFGYLFAHYNASDLVSAGMPAQRLEAVRLPMHRYRRVFVERMKMRRTLVEPERKDMTLAERWEALEPYWNAIRNTAYAKQTLVAIKDLFGFDDLNRDTHEPLSRAIAETRRPGWYRHVMKEKGRIAISVLDAQISNPDRERFAPVMRLDHFIAVRSRAELNALERESGISIHSLDDLVRSMHLALERYLEDGICGVKSALAYERTLQYDKVTKTEAEVAFNRIAGHLGEGPSWPEAKPLQDYMMHQVIRAAVDAGLPVQIHTGLQEGNENIITNSNPTLLVNLFIEYREAKFDLFHGGYPYIHEWVTLAKNFANVYADMTWVHIISPEIGRRQLHELIETVPGNKIMAFGGDAITVELAYAHSRIARQVVTRVLSEKVADRYMDESEAIALAGRFLRENPAELFKLV